MLTSGGYKFEVCNGILFHIPPFVAADLREVRPLLVSGWSDAEPEPDE